MDPRFTRKQFVSSLVEVTSVAISHGRLEDAESVLIAVRQLRPKLNELDALEAWILIKRGHWHDAIRVLNKLDASTSNWSLGKALMAFCQFAVGDPSWSISANEVLENNPGDEAAGLVKLLMGKDEGPAEAEAPAATAPSSFADYDPRSMQQAAFLRA